MMKNSPINVFILDDEFPVINEFRQQGVYNSAISKENLYHLAIHGEWNHLRDLQQLIVDIVTSEACKAGLINLVGFNTPTQALTAIGGGLLPDVLIYDWEYPNAPINSSNSRDWLLEILHRTETFVFVYSKMRDEIPRFLNQADIATHSNRFQLFLKGGKIEYSFSAEEYILQHIIGTAVDSGEIKINDIRIKFTANKYLESASDILYLQRILGKQFVLDELDKVEFTVNELGVEKILNDSEGFLLFNASRNILMSPNETIDEQKLGSLDKLSYAEVIEKFSLNALEDTLERGFLVL